MSNSCDTTGDAAKQGCSTEGRGRNDSECCDMPEKLLCLADEAWRELLKEKIKQEIEKSSGPKLNALAKLVAETNHLRWTHMFEAKQKCEEFKQQLKGILLQK